MTFHEHVQDRGGGFCKQRVNCYVDTGSEVITFPLWTTNGKLVGYQRYDWRADKLRSNDTKGKYYTYRDKNILSCWGIDCNDLTSAEDLFVVEGIWDAISVINTGRRCVAVLSNNPQNLKTWFRTLPCRTVALCDGDKAGKMLSRVCDKAITMPQGVDCNDMSLLELNEYLKEKL